MKAERRMEWMGLIVTAGVVIVLICAGIFELLERRKRAVFKEQIHDLAQKYIDKMKQEEHVWVAATCPMPPFYLVRPVQEGGVHSIPPGANPGAYRQRPNIHPPKKGLRYERRKENWLFRRTGKQPR